MITQFSLRLICGMSLMWSVMPRREVTSGFFRIQMLVALGLSVLAALTVGQFRTDVTEPLLPDAATTAGCIALAAAGFIGSVLWTLERRKGGTWVAFLIAVISAGLLVLSSPVESTISLAASLRILSELSSAAILGGAVTGMLLGHWYLTAPTMSIDPLSRLNFFYGCATIVRLVLSAIALAAAWQLLEGTTDFIWIGLRWIAGIVGPIAVFVMVSRILKYRNTQSATGVLFVGVILTFIGEMTAALLYQKLQHPF